MVFNAKSLFKFLDVSIKTIFSYNEIFRNDIILSFQYSRFPI